MEKDNKSKINSFIAFGFGSSDTGVNLYWSNDALRTIEKHIHKQHPTDNPIKTELSDEKS
ncbi:MAG: hypothetical protein K0R93_2063 [Anaerosolibacter sp.]|jgi:hypothetical protein|uniref:hypothetical protein n=1 Tax=Anaerosolibacter sp. TaxID=1872527 RepID=UPI002637E45B|nr:hypothetical protein [Anaerosolibacter sp.]MDF2547165.1 hypothetical protein [Anaerosolibacter sp.]